MKKTYQLKDGGIIAVASAADIVSALRQSSKFDNDLPDEQYMHDFAHRYKIQTGHVLTFTNADTFVAELARTGFINEKS